uniref:Uncharacterized protein n=1 Tax=Balaenoptera musculus TaxID=9771 RepID=A0A8C0DG93_BALMU
QARAVACRLGTRPVSSGGTFLGVAALKPKQLPQKQKTTPFSSGFCFSFLLLSLAQGHGRSNVRSGS